MKRLALVLCLLATPASAGLFYDTARLAGGVVWSEQHCQLKPAPAAKQFLASVAQADNAAFKEMSALVWIELNRVSSEIGNEQVCKNMMPSIRKFNESFDKK